MLMNVGAGPMYVNAPVPVHWLSLLVIIDVLSSTAVPAGVTAVI